MHATLQTITYPQLDAESVDSSPEQRKQSKAIAEFGGYIRANGRGSRIRAKGSAQARQSPLRLLSPPSTRSSVNAWSRSSPGLFGQSSHRLAEAKLTIMAKDICEQRSRSARAVTTKTHMPGNVSGHRPCRQRGLGPQDAVHHAGEGCPLGSARHQRRVPGRGQPIDAPFRPAAARHPLPGDQALALEPMQGWIQHALAERKRARTTLLNCLRQFVSMHRLLGEERQYEARCGALQ